MATTTDRGERTRLRILEVAAGLYAEHGYAGTSLNEIIRASGLTKGAFYFHFDSKAELALEVYRHKQHEWLERVTAITAGDGRALDRFIALGRALAEMIEADPTARCVGKLAEALVEEPGAREHVLAQLDGWVELSAQLLREAQGEGDVAGDIDARRVAEMAVSSFIGFEHVAEMRGGGLREQVECLIDVLARAVKS